jgi:hypothetical protein
MVGVIAGKRKNTNVRLSVSLRMGKRVWSEKSDAAKDFGLRRRYQHQLLAVFTVAAGRAGEDRRKTTYEDNVESEEKGKDGAVLLDEVALYKREET